jgi:2-(1,2-epoxy-1,2-dihydrophenyl)acetyl-CoA isomerase
MANNDSVIIEKEGGIATIKLNRPEKLNAIDEPMLKRMAEVFADAAGDDAVKALVVTGAGRGFCSGADVGNVLQKEEGEAEEFPRDTEAAFHRLTDPLSSVDKPVIAAINGVAAGAGVSLALLCDIRIASENARFGLAFVRRGLIPDAGATYSVPRAIGLSKALWLMFTGDMIDAGRAEQLGLVDQVVPQEALEETVTALAKRIASGPSVAISLMKRAAYRGIHSDLNSQLEFEAVCQAICRRTEDCQEGVNAFLEKREPKFKGR